MPYLPALRQLAEETVEHVHEIPATFEVARMKVAELEDQHADAVAVRLAGGEKCFLKQLRHRGSVHCASPRGHRDAAVW